MKITIKIGKNGTNAFFIKGNFTDINEAGFDYNEPKEFKKFLELLLNKNHYQVTGIDIEE